MEKQIGNDQRKRIRYLPEREEEFENLLNTGNENGTQWIHPLK